MKNYLVASDLDGTLLDSLGKVSKENWAAIEEMGEKGIYFVPASGRCFLELPTDIRESDLIRYYILSGGAVIYDKKEDRFEMTCVTKEKKDRILDEVFRYCVCLFAHTGRESCVDGNFHNAENYESYNMNEYWVRYALEKETPVENFKEYIYGLEKIPMLVVFFRYPEELKACKAVLEQDDEILVVQTDPNNIEIVSKQSGKGNALLRLADSLGVPRENTVAIGDSQNDRTMLETAGLSLAMGNAIPEIKEISQQIVCDNNSHVARYILDHYLL